MLRTIATSTCTHRFIVALDNKIAPIMAPLPLPTAPPQSPNHFGTHGDYGNVEKDAPTAEDDDPSGRFKDDDGRSGNGDDKEHSSGRLRGEELDVAAAQRGCGCSAAQG